MEAAAETARGSKAVVWVGRVISALPVLMMLFGASMTFAKRPEVTEGLKNVGYPEHLAMPLAIVQVVCCFLYVLPRTSVLGAILLTGYLGGATATHVRLGQPFHMAVIVGVLVWLGLLLRERRLRTLLPLRRPVR